MILFLAIAQIGDTLLNQTIESSVFVAVVPSELIGDTLD